MKKNIVLILVCVFTQSCFAQETKLSEINFFDFVVPSDISIRTCKLNDKQTISYFSCGLDTDEPKNGMGGLLVIPKKEFGVWKIEDKSELKREELWKNSQKKIESAKDFLSAPKDSLFAYFDLYVFYIRGKDVVVDGSYMSDDGRLMDDYQVKDYATVYTYKYDSVNWIEVRKDNIGTEGLRTYGAAIINEILKNRFSSF